jgi:hypothetical protein
LDGDRDYGKVIVHYKSQKWDSSGSTTVISVNLWAEHRAMLDTRI